MRKIENVPINYAVTREQKRYIAKKKMREEGKKNFCRHGYTTITKNGFTSYNRESSYFAKHWREYVPMEGVE